VDDGAGLQPILWNIPQLLDANGKLRRLGVGADLQLTIELLGEVAAHAVGEDRDLRHDVGAGLEGTFRLAVLADAAIAGADTDDASFLDQHVLPREAPEHVDAFGFHLIGEPLRKHAQRDDVVAVVLERRRRDRQAEPSAFGQEIDVVVVDRRAERRFPRLEIGNEILERRGIEEGTRELMDAGLAALFDHCDRQRLAALALLQLREA